MVVFEVIAGVGDAVFDFARKKFQLFRSQQSPSLFAVILGLDYVLIEVLDRFVQIGVSAGKHVSVGTHGETSAGVSATSVTSSAESSTSPSAIRRTSSFVVPTSL